MAITFRTVTGSALTYEQVDENFSSLIISASYEAPNLSLHFPQSAFSPPGPLVVGLGAAGIWEEVGVLRARTEHNVTVLGNVAITGSLNANTNIEIGIGTGEVRTNLVFGSGSLKSNQFAPNNTAIGSSVLTGVVGSNGTVVGGNNTVIGYEGARLTTTGEYNSVLGSSAFRGNFTGNRNVVVGALAFTSSISGNNNTVLGTFAGNNLSGNSSGNVIIGLAGPATASIQSDRLYIGTSTGIPLIGGNFNTKTVEVSGSLKVYSDLNIGESKVQPNTIASTPVTTAVLHTIPTATYNSAFVQYSISRGTDARAGQLLVVWNGSTVEFTDVSTTDIGDTSSVVFTAVISGANVEIRMAAAASGWNVRSLLTTL